MKVAVVIFLFLCFHLLGGPGSACVGLRDGKTAYLSSGVNTDASAPVSAGWAKDEFLAESSGTDDDNQLVGIQDDEDETEVFVRKNFRSDRQFSSFLYAFPSTQYRDRSSVKHPFFKTFFYTCSHLYLEQKALLI